MSTDIDFTTQDKRTIERQVRQGFVDEKTVDKALKALPDLADKAAPVEASLLDDDDFDDEGDE